MRTESNFYWTFNDKLNSLIRQTFGQVHNLYFVTFQPPKNACLSPEQVSISTNNIFGSIPYVLVPEQTYKVRRYTRSADYSENWHAHLIVNEEGWLQLSASLSEEHDIVTKRVYDKEGLICYLSKQAPRNRILPSASTPSINIEQTIPDSETKVVEQSEERLLTTFLAAFIRLISSLKTYFNTKPLLTIKYRPFLPNCPP